MKINDQSPFPLYRRSVSGSTASREPGESGEKVDVAEFSRGRSNPGVKGMATIKSRLHYEIAQPTAQARLEDLSNRIRLGQYFTPTDDLVNALLEEAGDR